MANDHLTVDTDLMDSGAGTVEVATQSCHEATTTADGSTPENMRPGDFPEAEELRNRAVEVATFYRTELRKLRNATDDLGATLREVADGYVAVEAENSSDPGRWTASDEFQQISNDLGLSQPLAAPDVGIVPEQLTEAPPTDADSATDPASDAVRA